MSTAFGLHLGLHLVTPSSRLKMFGFQSVTDAYGRTQVSQQVFLGCDQVET